MQDQLIKIEVDPTRDTPPSQQISNAILDAMANDDLLPGDKVPSVRQLATDVLVNPNTVSKAYRDLESRGVLKGESGRGVFVTETGPDVARAIRRQCTLDELRLALVACVRVGHDTEEILSHCQQTLEVRSSEITSSPIRSALR